MVNGGSVAGVEISITEISNVFLINRPACVTACNVKVYVPEMFGVPESVVPLRVIPGGKNPPTKDTVTGAGELTVIVLEYG
jgi:hypothetical protein